MATSTRPLAGPVPTPYAERNAMIIHAIVAVGRSEKTQRMRPARHVD